MIELQIAKELKVSQSSVREALRELEAARLVESIPHRGTRVRVISDRELAESYQVRGLLEQTAALASADHFKENVSELTDQLQLMGEASQRRDLTAYAAANHKLHRHIVEKSDNLVLLRMWESLSFETRTLARLHRPEVDPVLDVDTHRPIIEALNAGDGPQAGQLLLEHAISFAPCATIPLFQPKREG